MNNELEFELNSNSYRREQYCFILIGGLNIFFRF